MQILNHNGKEFCVAHFQGKCQSKFSRVVDVIDRQDIIMPEDVEIVTATNHLDVSILVKQLEKCNINFINKVEQGSYWTNLKKPGYIIEGLRDVQSKYALIVDADDVLLTKDIVNIVEKFKLFQKELIFGATKNNFPDLLIDKVYDRDFRGAFRYLNAGSCFGTVDICLKFYSRANEILHNNLIYNPLKSEQLIIRNTFKDATDYVDFDYQCTLFQTFDNTYVWENNNSYTII